MLFLVVIASVGAYYRTSVMVSVFPPEQQTFLNLTSKISAFIHLLIGLMIYAAIFYTTFVLNKLFRNPIAPNDYLSSIASLLMFLAGIELLKVFNSVFFLSESVSAIPADELFVQNLPSTLWFQYNKVIEIIGIVGVPFFTFLAFRTQGQTNSSCLINAGSIGSCFLLVMLIRS